MYRKCECGLYGDCFDPDKWCNCDSGHDGWLYDGGELMVSSSVAWIRIRIASVFRNFVVRNSYSEYEFGSIKVKIGLN